MSQLDNDDFDQPKSELELRMEKNIRERNEFFANMYKELAEQHADIAEYLGVCNATKKPSQKRKFRKDKNVSFRTSMPSERRKSERLAHLPVKYNFTDLDDLLEPYSVSNKSSLKVSDLAENFSKPKKKSISINRTPAPVLDVSEVTNTMLVRIAHHINDKQYSGTGTTCHQCRQKTLDTKTVCRSGMCFGVRGQFCGICLKNRYGESVESALLDSKWSCPPCRNLCNCSICRNNAGKRPTGILTPLARRNGFLSVKDFLDNLNGKGDIAENNVCSYDSDEDFSGFNTKDEHFMNYDKIKANLIFFRMQHYSLTDFLGFNENDHL